MNAQKLLTQQKTLAIFARMRYNRLLLIFVRSFKARKDTQQNGKSIQFFRRSLHAARKRA